MGFYIELVRFQPGVYSEGEIPKAYWVLYGIGGFALICMGGAAYALLIDLAKTGWIGDQILVGSIVGAIPLYLLLGLKLVWVRKYVEIGAEVVQTGFRFAGYTFLKRSVHRSEVAQAVLFNKKPSENIAPTEHRNSQYYIRGHWRVGLKLKNGQFIVLDKHTEKEAIHPLFQELQDWVTSSCPG